MNQVVATGCKDIVYVMHEKEICLITMHGNNCNCKYHTYKAVENAVNGRERWSTYVRTLRQAGPYGRFPLPVVAKL
jgi:hypothetical protein